MLCDCEYAEKHDGMDEGMQLACEVKKLTLDNVTTMVRGTDKLTISDTPAVRERSLKKKYNYENCSCFEIKHIHDLCELCVRGCRSRARWAYLDRKEEERARREGETFEERLVNVSEERRGVVAKWMGQETGLYNA